MIIPVSTNLIHKNLYSVNFSSKPKLTREERKINRRVNIDRAKTNIPFDCHFDVRRIKKIRSNSKLHIEDYLCSDEFKESLKGYEIRQFFENINKDNTEYVLPFLEYQARYNKRNGTNYENLGYVDNALFAINKENRSAIRKILVFGEQNNISLRALSRVMQATNKNNINYIDTFFKNEYSNLRSIDKTLSVKDFSDILSNISNKNFHLYKSLMASKKPFTINEIKVLTAIKDLYQYRGVTDVNQLTVKQQRNLFSNILTKCNQLVINESEFIEKNYPLIPITQEKYNEVLINLSKSFASEPKKMSGKDWYIKMQKSENKSETAKEIAFYYRKPGTFSAVTDKADYSHLPLYSEYKKLVDSYIREYQTTSFVFPQTRIPSADKISSLYEARTGNIVNKVININKDTNFQKLGFDEDVTYDNFYAIAHSFCNNEFNKLNYKNKLLIIDVFANLNTQNILSASFIDPNNHRTFRKYGVILDVAHEDMLGGYFRDFASEFNKNQRMYMHRYVNGNKKNFVDYYANKFMEQLGFDKQKYIEFLSKTQDCRTIGDFQKVLDKKTFTKYQEFIRHIERNGAPLPSRRYNEIFVQRGKPRAVYAYNTTYRELPVEFKKFAQEKNIPIILFDDTRALEPEPKVWF